MSMSRKEAAIKKLREDFTITGDGVAHRDMEKAFSENSSFLNSAKKLIEIHSELKEHKAQG